MSVNHKAIQPMVNTIKKASKTTGRSLGSYGNNYTSGASYVFPRNGNIPVDRYHATVDKIIPSTSGSGNPSIDVCYTLKDSKGNVYHVRQRIAQGTFYMNAFLNALIKAGVNVDEVAPDEVSAVSLDVDLDYDENGFGQITFPQTAIGVTTCKHQKVTSMQQLLDDDDDKTELDEEDVEDYFEEEAE